MPIGGLRGGDDSADADRVDGDRFLHEDMVALLDRLLEVVRTEVGRCCENDHVDVVASHQLLVGIDAGVRVVLGERHLIGVIFLLAEVAEA